MGWSLQITQLHKCMVSGLLTHSYSIQQLPSLLECPSVLAVNQHTCLVESPSH